jgi:hypothetical protein
MNEMCVEASPFEIQNSEIIYTKKFKDIDAYKKATTNELKIRDELVDDLFCSEKPDKLSFILDVASWEYYGNKAYFSIYSTDPEITSIDFKIREIT